jgi:hypothetical protein
MALPRKLTPKKVQTKNCTKRSRHIATPFSNKVEH